jgi:hypothetical protein
MNRRILIATAAALGLIVLSSMFWVPPILRTARKEPTPTVVLPTATPAPPTTHDLRINVADAETGEPIANAQIMLGDAQGNTDNGGTYETSLSHGITTPIKVHALGYESWQSTLDTTQALDKRVALDVSLPPNAVRGQVVGIGLTPLPQAAVTFRGHPVPVDDEGRFVLRRVTVGDEVIAASPGYLEGSAVVDGYPTLYLVLEPVEVVVHVRDAMMGVGVPETWVCVQERCEVTDLSGSVAVRAVAPGGEVVARREGYQDTSVTYAGTGDLTIELPPAELYGHVRDAETGDPITRTIVLVGDQIMPIDENGMYHVSDLTQADSIFVKSPGYERVTIPIGPNITVDEYDAVGICQQPGVYPCADISLPRFAVRGIYASFNLLVWDKPKMLELIDLVDRSPILNAIVVDIKGDFGYIAFESEDPLIVEVDAMIEARLPVEEFLQICKEKGIYTVARMVVFKDSPLAAAYPELAVRHPNGEVFYDREGMAWIDPTKEESWEYSIAVTKEAIRLGFDEVQYDYLRFPSDSTSLEVVRALVYSVESTIESRTAAIQGFIKAAKAAVDPTHAFLSADLFGYALVIAPDHDMRIGQRLKDLAPHVDYVCPMIYPSTFESGNLGLASPKDEPYTVIKLSMALAHERTDTPVRPWLQGYWYEREDFANQRRAAEEASELGWCFWNARGQYDAEFFIPPESTGS